MGPQRIGEGNPAADDAGMTRVAAAGIWCYLTYMYSSTPNMEITVSRQQPETHIAVTAQIRPARL